MEKSASVKWQGNILQGAGFISTESGALSEVRYGFQTRFEGKPGTNPEELIAAAHASCFAMAVASELSKRKLNPKLIEVDAKVKLEKIEGMYAITAVHLNLTADVPDAGGKLFAEAVNFAKENCPVSKLLNAKITMESELLSALPKDQLVGL